MTALELVQSPQGLSEVAAPREPTQGNSLHFDNR